jgi:hypothetical protein
MRKMIIALAAAGTTLAIATPAVAQYVRQPQPYGYNNGYNGYNNNNWGQVRALQARLNNVERQINRLDRRDRIRNNAADRLRFEANQLEQRLRYAGRGGLNPNEANDINVRIARLEQRVQFAMNGRNGGYGWNNNGYNNGQFADRDRDGRDD